MEQRFYLASPYTSESQEIRAQRFEKNCQAAAWLTRCGLMVYSPIIHGHFMVDYGIPMDFDFWEGHCLSFLSVWATAFVILKLQGWEESKGVSMEFNIAKELKLPCFELSPARIFPGVDAILEPCQ